ncbi:MAG: TIGR03862 family flavoprotein, partial [Rhodocyclaceae bacterium]|nr:TIGR03862 family flavoprotein [Rhodocyclaceae bacterium]
GGGSWPQLGSDGAWVPLLVQRGVDVTALRPANCGFDVGWSEHFRTRFAGHPVKSVVASFTDAAGVAWRKQGEFVVTENGVEGGLIYALSAPLRDGIAARGGAVLRLDLAPGRELPRLVDELSRPRGSRSLSGHLQSRLGLKGVKVGLLRELLPAEDFADPARLAAAIKDLPLSLVAPRPLAEAISSAGGVAFEALDECLMIRALPGVFCAGEMLDWEAPTGGYLLTACFASGRAAGLGALAWLKGLEA